MTAPLIVSATFDDADFAYLDGLRRAHFPPDRNVIAAHLTLFHHLPPSIADELRHRLAEEARMPPPSARLTGPMSLGRGVALRVHSPDLEALRERIADAFEAVLIPQDRQGWRPHVTIQNKVDPPVAKALQDDLATRWQDRRLAITGLAAWWYRGGPWEPAFHHAFRGR